MWFQNRDQQSQTIDQQPENEYHAQDPPIANGRMCKEVSPQTVECRQVSSRREPANTQSYTKLLVGKGALILDGRKQYSHPCDKLLITECEDESRYCFFALFPW